MSTDSVTQNESTCVLSMRGKEKARYRRRQTERQRMKQKGAAELPRVRCGTDGGECR